MSEQDQPHTLVVALDCDRHGLNVEWSVRCPYDGTGPRPCLLIDEADCPGYVEGSGCPLDDEGLAGYSEEFGHGHEIKGCAVAQYLEAVPIDEGALEIQGRIVLSAPVVVEWGDDVPSIAPLLDGSTNDD